MNLHPPFGWPGPPGIRLGAYGRRAVLRGVIKLVATVAVSALGLAACATRRSPSAADAVGTYDAVVELEGEPSRRVTVRLWAMPPDRLHVEIAGPVGGPQVVADGGGGRMTVAFPRERAAYVGSSDPDESQPVLGLDLPLDELVAAIRDGTPPSGKVIVKRDGPVPGLPASLDILSLRLEVHLRLRNVQRVDPGRLAQLGRGVPPDGFALFPMDQLRDAALWSAAGR